MKAGRFGISTNTVSTRGVASTRERVVVRNNHNADNTRLLKL